MGRAAHLEGTRGLLIVNPQSGKRGPSAAELEHEAARRGLDVHVLAPGDDPQAVAREATGPIGVAGGDGSLGAVAEVALERDLPFVCIPFGTRNHFARDIGLSTRTSRRTGSPARGTNGSPSPSRSSAPVACVPPATASP